MAALVFLGLVVLAMVAHLSGAAAASTWCLCKEGVNEAQLQKTLDYACGAGADCTLIHQNGACFNPNTVRAHCNYAVNSYFQKKGQAPGSCDFTATAIVTTSDPSTTGCVYPSSASAGTTTTPPVTSNNPTGGSPFVTTPTTSTGILGGGGIGTGLSPTGAGINTDVSRGGFALANSSFVVACLTATLLSSGLLLWWD